MVKIILPIVLFAFVMAVTFGGCYGKTSSIDDGYNLAMVAPEPCVDLDIKRSRAFPVSYYIKKNNRPVEPMVELTQEKLPDCLRIENSDIITVEEALRSSREVRPAIILAESDILPEVPSAEVLIACEELKSVESTLPEVPVVRRNRTVEPELEATPIPISFSRDMVIQPRAELMPVEDIIEGAPQAELPLAVGPEIGMID